MSPVGLQNTCINALQGAFSTSWFHKCLCGTIPTTFSQVPGRDSQGLRPFFPRVNICSIVTTNARCRFRSSRAALTSADGKVAESARCCPPGFHVAVPCILILFEGLLLSLFLLSRCGGIVLTCLSARSLPSSWPDTASL